MKSISICGREYPLRFSLRVVKACESRYGSMDQMLEVIQLGKTEGHTNVVDEFLWLLRSMLDSGVRYARFNGIPCEDPPDEDVLLDVLDLKSLQGTLFSAMAGDNERTVEAKPGKNGESAEENLSS